jgi:toxin-antitoxin system PIN domain toxin
MTKFYLLDVNVLVALFDEAHIHHDKAHDWFKSKGVGGWVSCPITENGFLRVLSHPSYPNTPLPTSDLAARFEEFKMGSGNHQFWSDDFSPSAWMALDHPPVGSAQSTDAYLLKLCHRNKGVLATFDQRIKPALIGASTSEIIEHITP